MLLFSEYLRELLEAKKMTVSALARLTGVERTTLSKALTGQRVFPYDALDALIYHLRLTPGEEKRFRYYYDAQFEREGIRRSREVIGKMFEDLANLNFAAPAFEETRLLMNLGQYAGERSVFSGATNVQPLLRMVLTDELSRPDARIELTVPPARAFLTNELLHRYLNGPVTAEITQIIAFDASGMAEDINLHNLECFCRVLPLCLLSRRSYHPYYYYDSGVSNGYTDPSPHFLVTHSCVVCLSEDGEQAMLLRSADQVACYHRHFRALLEQCYSLIQYTSDPLEIIEAYQRCTEPDGFYMAMAQPCFGRFYSDEMIATYLRHELPFFAQILRSAQYRFATLRQVSKFYTMFTESGLRRFLQSGSLDDYPVAVVTPFPPAERRRLMRCLAAAIRSGDVTGRCMRDGVFPEYLSMCTSNALGVGFFTTEQFPLTEGLCSVQIKEATLCRAFHYWLTHLPDSGKTLTADETAGLLEHLVSTCGEPD